MNDEEKEELEQLAADRPPTDLNSPAFFSIRISGEQGEEVIEFADFQTLEAFIQAYQKFSEAGYDISLDWERVYLH